MKISIIESGIGNIQSVLNSCKRLNLEVYIARSGEDLKNQNPDRIILPGVGTISKAITNLKSNNLWDELNNKEKNSFSRYMSRHAIIGIRLL